MNKLLKYLILPCLGAALFFSCLSEDEVPCYSYVRFEYDYNMSFVDLFYKQASMVDLFMFDKDDVYQGVINVKSSGDTFEQGYMLQLPEGIDKDTKFLAWAGLYPASFSYTGMTAGSSTIDDLVVALNAVAGTQSDKDLDALWYGTLEGGKITYTDEVNTIKMVKNTNNIRVVLQLLESEDEIDVKDFDFTFTAKNNSYDYQNNVADNVERVYTPFYSANHNASMAAVEFSTLRLLEDNDNRLLVTRNGQAEPILDVNLNEYIDALKLEKYKKLSLQEFMDREDEYKVIIFLTKEGGGEPGDDGRFLSAYISINEWIVREQFE